MGANALNVSGDWVRTGRCGDLDGDGDVQRGRGAGVQPGGLDAAERYDQQHGAGDGDAGEALDLGGTLTLTSGTLAAGAWAVNVGGNFMRTAGVFTSRGTLTFDGTVAQTFQVGGSTFQDLVINNTGPAAVTRERTLTIRNLTLTLGTLVMGGNALNVSGDWVRTGGRRRSTGTVTFNGAAAQAFNPAGSDAAERDDERGWAGDLGGAAGPGGTLTLHDSGTLAAGAWAVNVGGNFMRTARGLHLGRDADVRRDGGADVPGRRLDVPGPGDQQHGSCGGDAERSADDTEPDADVGDAGDGR